jgi:hypothetical protein
MEKKYAELPEFGQFVEYITQADPVPNGEELFYDVIINKVGIDVFDFTNDKITDTVLEDVKKIIEIKTRKLEKADGVYFESLKEVVMLNTKKITPENLLVLDKVDDKIIEISKIVDVLEVIK